MLMMKRKLNFNTRRSGETTTTSCSSAKQGDDDVEWEMRPGGMLVQMRSRHEDSGVVNPPPNLRLRVAYGVVRYQISANSLSTFGELKKLLTAETGLQPGEQRLIFRGKERENGEYLDTCGVKDRSKVVVIEDPESRERRMIEMRRDAKIQAVHQLIDDVSTEVDRLAQQKFGESKKLQTTAVKMVCAIEKSIGNGNKVAEVQITTLIEMLMRQAVKLDSIPADGNACAAAAKKDLQGQRVQRCVEMLDVLKVSNTKRKVPPLAPASTKWETFDFNSSPKTSHWEIFD